MSPRHSKRAIVTGTSPLTGLPLFSACRYTATAERAAEMSRCKDGGASRPRGRAPGLFPQKGGTRAGLQQVSRQDGQEYTVEAQGAETEVSAL